jgi:succinyl-diaminopimelate desuccinylase
MNSIELTKKLISFKSVTPEDDGIMKFISETLQGLNFKKILVKSFSDINENAKDTLNLYASLFEETSGNNLCFAGHVDVVPAGKEYLWKYGPFEPVVEDGILYGRGASDMKAAIAAFITAVSEFLEENKGFKKGNISFLLTGDEEGNAINGTAKMLKHINGLGIKIDDCIVGEPTSEVKIGDIIKIGRRGSISFNLTINGVGGHIAYPAFTKNPITELAKVIVALKAEKFDNGTEFFERSNLEVVKVLVENEATNVVPEAASCFFNIRFNNLHTSEALVKKVHEIISKATDFSFKISHYSSGESFLNEKAEIADVTLNAVKEICGFEASFSTSGGTSDARFIKNYAQVVELGMRNKTAHKIDENVGIEEIETLKNIYKKILYKYF